MLSPRSIAHALLLVLIGLCLVGAGSAQALLYDLDFGTPPHTVGLPPATGSGPPPRRTVSSIPFGTPMVVPFYGNLTDQPCEFDSFDGAGDQFKLLLSDLPPSNFYQLVCQIEMGNVAPGDGLTILFDTPQIRSITFTAAGTVDAFVPGVFSGTIGTYLVGMIIDLRVDVDLAANNWDIYLDGSLKHSGSFGGATQVNAVRYSSNVSTTPGASFAVDNIKISEVPIVSAAPCERLEFEDVPVGTAYPPGSTFTTEGMLVEVHEFFFTPGPCAPPTTSGFAAAGAGNNACGSGREIEVNNVRLLFDFGGVAQEVSLQYGEYGGTVDLGINGDCQVVQNFADLDGALLGGVEVHVADAGVPGQSCGVLHLEGQVEVLVIGGQELFIDNLSFCRGCDAPLRSTFEDVPLGSTYSVGTAFNSDSAHYEINPFFFGPGCTNPFLNGFAEIQNGGMACGFGHELAINNVNVAVQFVNMPLDWLVLGYGEYGGNLNLEINGDCREFNDFADISGTSIGGVAVWAVDFGAPGQSCGMLYTAGTIGSFVLGGQELWIDTLHACPQATTAVTGPARSAALTTALAQNVPNPFNPTTSIHFALAEGGATRLTILDVAGRHLRTLVDGPLAAGEHTVEWDGRGTGGRRVSSGVYLYRLEAHGVTEVRRMIVLK